MSAAKPSLTADLRSLSGRSVIYGLGSVLMRASSLLVLPLYTRFLTPAEYGIVALGSTLTALLSLILSLSLYNAVGRLYFLAETPAARRRVIGTITFAMLGSSFVLSLLLDVAGASAFALAFPELPFHPYVRIAIWTAWFAAFSLVPLQLFQAQERPGTYVAWTAVTLFLTIALTILLVAVLRKGAFGYLLATLIANVLLAVPYVVVTLKGADFRLDLSRLKQAFAFSLPLVPHSVASWVLSVSDRAILQFYVPVAALGLYSLGYTFGMIQIMVSGAIANAWIPFVFKRAAEEGDAAKARIARLSTYYVLVICTIAVGLCLFSREAIQLLLAPSFHPAHEVVVPVVVGYLWNGLYVLPQTLLFLKSRTGWVPVATIAAGAANVAVNLALIPTFGIIAAAWATFIAFLVMLVVLAFAAHRVDPFPYEYRRVAAILTTTGLVIWAGAYVNISLVADVLVKLALFAAFPLTLVLGGFLETDERSALRRVGKLVEERISMRPSSRQG